MGSFSSIDLPSCDLKALPRLETLVGEMLAAGRKTSLYSKKALSGGLLELVWGSCAAIPFVHTLEAKSMIDIGGGNGLPGLVLAVLLPDIQVHLHELSEKKVAVAHHLAKRCGVNNYSASVNPLGPAYRPVPADLVVSRATALWRSTWNIPNLPDHKVIFGSWPGPGRFLYEARRSDGTPLVNLTSTLSLTPKTIKEAFHARLAD